MRVRWPLFLLSLSTLFACGGTDARRKYELEPAPDFLFERHSATSDCEERRPGSLLDGKSGTRAVLVAGNRAPYALTRKEELVLTRKDIPALTITSDPSSNVAVRRTGGPDWKVSFCAAGEGNSETEAKDALQTVTLERVGSALSLKNPLQLGIPKSKASLAVDAPSDAPIVVHASYSAVEIWDVSGPVRVSATHARATILNTTGLVSAMAPVIDFAGARGDIDLSAEWEINLKITATRFEGRLMAWAQRPVRMLVPPGFTSSFEATVTRPQDFVCQADFCSQVKHETQNGLHVFKYAGDGGASKEPVLRLRSEGSTVVIYGSDRLLKR